MTKTNDEEKPSEGEIVELKLRVETTAWLRKLLENMQVNGPARDVRKLLAYSDEVLSQLPGNEEGAAV